MRRGDVEQGMRLLHHSLYELRLQLPGERWRELVHGSFRPHPLAELVREDPLTRRSFEKPRGYAGDAVLLDLIYTAQAPPATSDLGRAIFGYTSRSPGCQTVRFRRQVMAEAIDAAEGSGGSPTVISVACGHLREAEDSNRVRDGRVSRFIALDLDEKSLAVVRAEQPGIEALQASVRDIIRGRLRLPEADLIYSAGLFDYLSAAEARLLTVRLVSTLKPGGRLLVANLMPDLFDIGYMEACMDWWLTYRAVAEVAEFCASVPQELVAARDVFTDAGRTVAFLQIERR